MALSAVADRVIETVKSWIPAGQEFITKRELLNAATLLLSRDEWQHADVISAYFDSMADSQGHVDLIKLELALRRPFSQPRPGKGQPGAPQAKGAPKGQAQSSRLGQMEVIEGGNFQDQLRETLAKKTMRVSDLFLEWDIDNDGNVSKDEFRKSLANLGIVVKPAQLDAMFQSFDKDNNGNIRWARAPHRLRPVLTCPYRLLPSPPYLSQPPPCRSARAPAAFESSTRRCDQRSRHK